MQHIWDELEHCWTSLMLLAATSYRKPETRKEEVVIATDWCPWLWSVMVMSAYFWPNSVNSLRLFSLQCPSFPVIIKSFYLNSKWGSFTSFGWNYGGCTMQRIKSIIYEASEQSNWCDCKNNINFLQFICHPDVCQCGWTTDERPHPFHLLPLHLSCH